MTPTALYSGARKAVKLARECERQADLYDKEWWSYMRKEAVRHRERAAGYLKSRKLLIAKPRQDSRKLAA